MRQMLISEIFPPRTGGSGRWFWEIYRRQPQGEYFVAPGQTDLPCETIDVEPWVVRRLPLTLPEWGMRRVAGMKGYLQAVRETAQLVRTHKIDRLHCGRMLPEGWIAWLLKRWRGLPYLCFVHGEEASYGKQSRELGWMMRRVLRGADLLVANSHNTAEILRRDWEVPDEKLRVLHPGADVERFRPAPKNEETREKLSWKDRLVVLTVGRLQLRKGHDTLLRALPAIVKAVPSVLYAVAGDGEERPRLEALIEELRLQDHVQLLGELQDERLIECYQQSDLFVLPNRDIDGDIEGFGMVLVEAQACGKPVIAGASGGTAETMDVGKSGLVIDCAQPELLAAEVVSFLKDPPRCQAMGQHGRAFVESHFAWPALSAEARKLLSFSQENQPEIADRASKTKAVSNSPRLTLHAKEKE